MKKSFTLKAAAFGLAVVTAFGASALTSRNGESLSLQRMGGIPINQSGKTVKVSNLAKNSFGVYGLKHYSNLVSQLDLTTEAASRAFEFYGDWEDAGTLTYTYFSLYKANMIPENGTEPYVKTYSYQKRVHRQNDQQFQIKISGWDEFTAAEAGIATPGVELILTVTPAKDAAGKVIGIVSTEETGAPLGWKLEYNTAGDVMDMYYYDAYTWFKNASKYTSISNSLLTMFAQESTYDYSNGTFEILPVYSGPSTDADVALLSLPIGDKNAQNEYTSFWYDTIKLSGKFYNYEADVLTNQGYFYRNAGETAGHYTAPFELNDNTQGVVKIVAGKLDETTLDQEFQSMMAAVDNPTSDMAVLTTPEGWFDLDVNNYADGIYSLVFAYTDGKPTESGNLSYTYGAYTVALIGSEFVQDGFANYNDVFVSAFVGLFTDKNGNSLTPEQMGLPSDFKANCRVQKSEKSAGSYRLAQPYSKMDIPKGSQFSYLPDYDYVYYNVADPAKAYVDLMLGGLTITLGSQTSSTTYIMCPASSEMASDNANLETNPWGTFADNKLTFAGRNYIESGVTSSGQQYQEEMGPLMSFLYDLNSGKYVGYRAAKPEAFLIETGAVDAIENVEAEGAADANAPAEYFNLQGQKVLNPAAGQLVIKKQGSKVTKIIAQ